MKEKCRKRLPEDMLKVLDAFDQKMADKNPPFHDSFLDGNGLIEEAIDKYYADGSKDNLIAVLEKGAPSRVISNFIDSSMTVLSLI